MPDGDHVHGGDAHDDDGGGGESSDAWPEVLHPGLGSQPVCDGSCN